MKNLANLMKQAKQMQDKMSKVQEELDLMTVKGEAGAGLVKITVNGKGVVKSVKIDPKAVEDRETLEDLIAAAMNNAKDNVDKVVKEKTSELMGGFELPEGLGM